MFIDYLTLMLANVTAGLVVLAWFLLRGINAEDNKAWAPAFGVVGLIATVTGFVMTLTWPLPEKVAVFNMAYGEMTVLFGTVYLGAAWALAKGWSLRPVAIVGVLSGAWAMLAGQQFLVWDLANDPVLAGTGFIVTGVAGVLTAVAVCLKRVLPVRVVVAALLLAAAVIWGLTTCRAYRGHFERFSEPLRQPAPAAVTPAAEPSGETAPAVQPTN